uniref:Uncharacterized protein n=1 Tax=Ignisphaera aggregans TaxID=334771 RepID=A0A7J2U1J7_9CREN
MRKWFAFRSCFEFHQVYKVALLYILMRFPVRGEELQRALPKGSNNPRYGVPGVALKAPKAYQKYGCHSHGIQGLEGPLAGVLEV